MLGQDCIAVRDARAVILWLELTSAMAIEVDTTY